MTFSLNRIICLIFCIVPILFGCTGSVTVNENSMDKARKINNDHAIKQVVGYFYIGGFTGKSYIVKINGLVVNYSVTSRGKLLKSKNIKLTAYDLVNFEKKLKSIGVMSWNNNYSNPRILDGTNWVVRYKSNTLVVNSKGKNNYPKNFNLLKSLVSKELLKGLSFQ